jgi:hypothetical protein
MLVVLGHPTPMAPLDCKHICSEPTMTKFVGINCGSANAM